MSQIFKPEASSPPPPGFVEFLQGTTGGAVPPNAGDVIFVLPDPAAPGIETNGNPGTNTIFIGLMQPTVCGTGQTVNTSTVTLVTLPLGGSAATYTLSAQVAGKAATQSGVGGSLFGVVRTDGITATVINVVTPVRESDLVLAGASFTFTASGGNILLTATGSLGTVINWNGCVTYTAVVAGV